MQLFDATENWDLKFPKACKGRNGHNFPRGAPGKKKKKTSKASWNFAKDPANFEDLIPHWTYAERVQFSGQMQALG